jgi:hypothetical protein
MDEFSDPASIASVARYKAALLVVRDEFGSDRPFSESKELRLLRAHYAAPLHTITSAQLAQQVGFPSYSAANLRYGLFASRVAAALDYRPGPFKTVSHKDPHWWRTLAYGNDGMPVTEDGEYEWVMRPELSQALEEMGWVPSRHH